MKKLFILCFAVLTTIATQAQTWTADKAHSKLSFTVTHMSISEVDGTFGKFDATVTSSKEDFSDAVFNLTADVASIATGNEMRDGHLKKEDMFDATKFPNLTFKSTGITKTADKKFALTGDLTIKGVTKSVTLDLTLLGTTVGRDGKKLAGFKAGGSINRKDFGVGAGMPAMMLSESVELRASGEFKAN